MPMLIFVGPRQSNGNPVCRVQLLWSARLFSNGEVFQRSCQVSSEGPTFLPDNILTYVVIRESGTIHFLWYGMVWTRTGTWSWVSILGSWTWDQTCHVRNRTWTQFNAFCSGYSTLWIFTDVQSYLLWILQVPPQTKAKRRYDTIFFVVTP